MKQTVGNAIERLVAFGLHYGMLTPLDAPFARNALLDILGLDEPVSSPSSAPVPETATPILRTLLDWAVSQGMIEDTVTARTLLDTRLMGCLTPRPSQLCERFEAIRRRDGVTAATDWFYNLSRRSNYIRADDIARNLEWPYRSSRYGRMEITINLSKPEKDPREIAKLKALPPSGYPRCLLCLENMGYAGRLNHPARQTLRVIPLTLNGEPWYLQYSPYVYYDQHCIVLKEEHVPMHIDRNTFLRLMDFIDQFPHYFVGSNADLPVVGGSILNHEHFQGGAHILPMARAPLDLPLKPPSGLPVRAGIVRWPMSVLRLTADDPEALTDAADEVLCHWAEYSDPSVGVLARSADGTPHNTLTPIARRRGEAYELDLVLRNNRATAEHPMGLFHPHANLHHVKKENIGLIEVMGLFILPGRLEKEIAALSDVLTGQIPYDETALGDEAHPLAKHLPWLRKLTAEYGTGLSEDEAASLLREEVGRICEAVLGDAGVFKDTAEGRRAFLRFLERLGYTTSA